MREVFAVCCDIGEWLVLLLRLAPIDPVEVRVIEKVALDAPDLVILLRPFRLGIDVHLHFIGLYGNTGNARRRLLIWTGRRFPRTCRRRYRGNGPLARLR